MEKNTTPRTSRRKRKVAAKVEAPKPVVEEVIEEVVEKVKEVVAEAPPILEVPYQPPAPKLVKPWEVVRPMPPTDGSTWQRGQKWRP